MVGIDISIFSTQVDSLFVCGICKKVAVEPVHCPKCSKFYCKECVKSKISICCKIILEVPGDLLMRFYNALQIVCTKCKDMHTIRDYIQHRVNCPKESEIQALRLKVSELITENNSLKLENATLKKQLESFLNPIRQITSSPESPKTSPRPKNIESNAKPPSKPLNIPKQPKQDPKSVTPAISAPKKPTTKQVRRSKTTMDEIPQSPKRRSSKAPSIINNPLSPSSPYNENHAATIIQRAFRKRNKAKIREAIMARRQERMNKTANKKVREDAKKACNDVQDLVKNLQSSPYKITEQK